MPSTNANLIDYAKRIEELATKLGLDYYPVNFELVPNNFMMEIAVYGLPVRMPHWLFGVRYIHQFNPAREWGYSRIFEVMFPGDPLPCLPGQQQYTAGKYIGDGACTGSRRFC